MSASILIVGSGAMACLFSARLAAAGQRVGMLSEWPEGMRALQQNGVCLLEDERRNCYPVDASSDPSHFRETRLALVLVKSWQTEESAYQLAACLHPDGLAVTLQNGLGNYETLAATLGEERVCAGSTTLGATLVEPGVVQPFGAGEVALGQHARLDSLLAALAAAGIRARVEPDLRSLLWGKLLINASINPLTALLRVPNGQLLENEHTRQLAAAVAGEVQAVAAALGIPLPYPDPAARVEEVMRQTAGNRSSMLQDILRGTPTEIEAITGAVIRAAERCGVDVPTNRALYQLVQFAAANPR